MMDYLTSCTGLVMSMKYERSGRKLYATLLPTKIDWIDATGYLQVDGDARIPIMYPLEPQAA